METLVVDLLTRRTAYAPTTHKLMFLRNVHTDLAVEPRMTSTLACSSPEMVMDETMELIYCLKDYDAVTITPHDDQLTIVCW